MCFAAAGFASFATTVLNGFVAGSVVASSDTIFASKLFFVSLSNTSSAAPLKYGSFTPPRNSSESSTDFPFACTAVTTNAGWSRCAVIITGFVPRAHACRKSCRAMVRFPKRSRERTSRALRSATHFSIRSITRSSRPAAVGSEVISSRNFSRALRADAERTGFFAAISTPEGARS